MNDNATHPSDELLADLATELLSDTGARLALEHMVGCPECEARFRAIASGWEHSAVRVGEILGREQKHDPVAVTAHSPLSGFVRTPWARWVIGAAAAVFAAWIVIPLWTRSPEGPRPTKLPPLTQDVLTRSALPTGQNEMLLRGLAAYARDDFEAAIDALREVEATGPTDALRRVYLASALVQEGQCEDAIRTLEDVPFATIPDPWSGESQWTRYVALTKCGRKEDAERVLRDLANYPGEAGERARTIINDTMSD